LRFSGLGATRCPARKRPSGGLPNAWRMTRGVRPGALALRPALRTNDGRDRHTILTFSHRRPCDTRSLVIGTADCCARATSGHAAVLQNSLSRIGPPNRSIDSLSRPKMPANRWLRRGLPGFGDRTKRPIAAVHEFSCWPVADATAASPGLRFPIEQLRQPDAGQTCSAVSRIAPPPPPSKNKILTDHDAAIKTTLQSFSSRPHNP
jgi:hypothetical protein